VIQKPVIFLAFANDREDHARYLRNIPQEHRQLREALAGAEREGICEVVERANVSISDLFDVFQDKRYRNRIAVFHYGGHADGYQLLLESSHSTGMGNLSDKNQSAHGSGLVAFLAKQKSLQLVFFNGCITHQQAAELSAAGVPAVIGTQSEIDDDVATQLATRFYKGLGQQLSLAQAWEEAQDEIRTMKGNDAQSLFRLGRAREAANAVTEMPWQLLLRENGGGWGIGKELFNRKRAAENTLSQLIAEVLDEFSRERMMQLSARLKTSQELLARYEEEWDVETDPKRQMRYEKEIAAINRNIEKIITEIEELKSLP
jgi:hypothetical protein